MYIGSNIQILRRQHQITQEQLAEQMNVSRQTVSKWEMNQAMPDLGKLTELCGLFNCTLDALVRENIADRDAVYSPVRIKTVRAFRMARYVMITPNPEADVIAYMDRWMERAGLTGREITRIGWDFPFVSLEQQTRFHLRGYAAACVLPEGFYETVPGVEYASQKEALYAVITITDPFQASFARIPGAYKRILDELKANGYGHGQEEDILPCFEHETVKDGMQYMDVYVHAGAPQ